MYGVSKLQDLLLSITCLMFGHEWHHTVGEGCAWKKCVICNKKLFINCIGKTKQCDGHID